MSATNTRGLADAFRLGFRRRFAEPSALKNAFRRARPASILLDLETEEIGRAEIGRRLMSGRFAFAGATVKPRTADALWKEEAAAPAWRIAAHSFDWLEDLAALGGVGAMEFGAAMFEAWLRERGERYDALVWRPDVAARRLRALVLHARLVLPAHERRREAALQAIGAHGEWLIRHLDAIPPGIERLYAAIALAEASLAIQGWETRRDGVAAQLDDALGAGVLADGCPINRNPEDAVTLFAQTRVLLERYGEIGETPPPLLDPAVKALAMAVRFFRGGDGGAPLFHGGSAIADGRIETQLSRVRLPLVAPQSLGEGRYERMSGGRVGVYIDVGGPPEGVAAATAHASALAIEMTAGRRRVIVNCGSAAHMDGAWARACRGAAAHSTLTFDDESFARFAPTQGVGGEEVQAVNGPAKVLGERKQERNGVWVIGAHEGYREEYGVRLTRRLFLHVDGGDFRGEDSALVEDAQMKQFQKRLSKASRADREKGFAFTARFHLHPSVAASMVADGEAVTLRLPNGEVWVMRQAGGSVRLEPSVYLGETAEPQETHQIVVTAGARSAATQIRWAFRRVGELTALPKDEEALAPREGPLLSPAAAPIAPKRPPFKR